KPYLVLYCIKHKQRSDKNVLYQIAQKAYEIAPNDPMALNNLGLANFAIGDKDEAIRFLELSIQSDPKSSVPHKNLCFIYTQLKMMDLAFQEAREAYRLDRSIQSGYILFFRLLNKNRIIAKILMNFLVIFFVIAFFVSLFSVFIWERLWLVVFPVVYLLLLLRNGINFLRQKLYFKGIVRITIVLASFVIFAFEIKRLDF
ncbi:MAG: hypothetical protein HOJ31_12115, partial [Anaerolineae bacterium]|nr:hypothetical protein [Anaerolineae bacterium]